MFAFVKLSYSQHDNICFHMLSCWYYFLTQWPCTNHERCAKNVFSSLDLPKNENSQAQDTLVKIIEHCCWICRSSGILLGQTMGEHSPQNTSHSQKIFYYYPQFSLVHFGVKWPPISTNQNGANVNKGCPGITSFISLVFAFIRFNEWQRDFTISTFRCQSLPTARFGFYWRKMDENC